jgi:hypothetical protein
VLEFDAVKRLFGRDHTDDLNVFSTARDGDVIAAWEEPTALDAVVFHLGR